MRAIHLARMPEGKLRPVLLLTRAHMVPVLTNVSVAPITSRVRGIRTEVPVGPEHGVDHLSVISLDNVQTIPAVDLGRQIGSLFDKQERALHAALIAAYDLADASRNPATTHPSLLDL